MSLQTQLLYSNTWTVRISDPGEEGTFNHLFETTKVNLIAKKETNSSNWHYYFTRQIEDKIEQYQEFTQLDDLFKFLGDFLDPVSLGQIGVKVGQLLV
ncbi:dithiol-disulfide isomerase [Mergibacter septicus]|uniref:Dithiol-disulfide isomerase n=1 Tax=Mergibacter septicus TaxID=221402 RepID=A0A8E3SDA5_9PAST|nr:DUF5377 domain-containing protein [Mergibacter septicus]AWX15993.1 dithiol-disulfide isomerase [Mergibacter septicus]QDJ15246.1 dithiol-disulfide isomerase [Mergibacter septicus]UTU47336.1 DUF5377 family protein [Mergibacter septicus]WMR95485.1 DUF5377 domain-containing protein [Mergibacter septicus]